MKNIKEEIFIKCKQFIEDKLSIVNQIITSNRNALQAETKSSAGDKHETGRAMLQLEMEKASQQYIVVSKMNDVLQKIDIGASNGIAKLGSLIETNQGAYFLAISVGKIDIVNKEIFIISPSSPIGKLLLGKVIGETVYYNGKQIKILEIL